MTELGNTEQAKVSDNHFSTLQEYIFWLQVLVYNTFGMKIPHTLQLIRNIKVSAYIESRNLNNDERNLTEWDLFGSFLSGIWWNYLGNLWSNNHSSIQLEFFFSTMYVCVQSLTFT